MRYCNLSLLITLLTVATAHGWKLQDSYNKDNWEQEWQYFTEDDPTHGTVKYVNNEGLFSIQDNAVRMGVDTTTKGQPRKSLRMSTKKTYDTGSLIIADIQHAPASVCGVWPAFWSTFVANATLKGTWPQYGEIDVIEGAHREQTNLASTHNAQNVCNFQQPKMAQGQGSATYSVHFPNGTGFGDSINKDNGGVFVNAWTKESISIYYFPRNKIPNDIKENKPNPESWGEPRAKFAGGCDIEKAFAHHTLIFNIDFCGDMGNPLWGQSCGNMGSSCDDFVKNNPEKFKDVYWLVNSVKVYTSGGNVDESSTSGCECT